MSGARTRLPRTRSSLLTLSIREWRMNADVVYNADAHTERKKSAISKVRVNEPCGKENNLVHILQAPPQQSSDEVSSRGRLAPADNRRYLVQPQQSGNDRASEQSAVAQQQLSSSKLGGAVVMHGELQQASALRPPTDGRPGLPSFEKNFVWVDCFFYGFWLEESKVTTYRNSVLPPRRR